MPSELERFVRDVESITTEWLADTYGHRSAKATETLFRLALIAARLPTSVSYHKDSDGMVVYRAELGGGIRVTVLSSLAWLTVVMVPGGEILEIRWTDVPEMISYMVDTVLVPPEVEEMRDAIGNAGLTTKAHVLVGCVVNISDTMQVIVSVVRGVYTTNMMEGGWPSRGDVVHADLGTLVAFVTRLVSPVPPRMSKAAKTRARKSKRDTAPSHSVEQHHV